MNRFFVKCPKCQRPVDAELYNQQGSFSCEGCQTRLTVHAFPALYRQQDQPSESTPAQTDDATCFYHPAKKAEQLCNDCGRLLCNLCALPFGEEVLCSACLELHRKNNKKHGQKARQMRYDKLAMMLMVCSFLSTLFFWFFPIIPAGLALSSFYVVIRYWKHRPEFAPGYKSRMVCSALLSLCAGTGAIFAGIHLCRKIFGA